MSTIRTTRTRTSTTRPTTAIAGGRRAAVVTSVTGLVVVALALTPVVAQLVR